MWSRVRLAHWSPRRCRHLPSCSASVSSRWSVLGLEVCETSVGPMSYARSRRSFAELGGTVNRDLSHCARNCARQPPSRLLEVSIADDRIAAVDTFALMSGNLHGNGARHASALHVAHGRPSEVMLEFS